MSMAASNAVGIGLASPETYTNREEQKKAALRLLDGLEKQVKHLSEGTKAMKIGAHNSKHTSWDDNISSILRLLDNCKLYIPPKRKKEAPLAQQLKDQGGLYTAMIGKCQKIEQELATETQENLQASLKTALANLAALKNGRGTLSILAHEKAAKLEGLLKQAKQYEISEGALDSFIFRMAQSISSIFVTEAHKLSQDIDANRLQRYRTLKEEWVTSSLLFDQMLSVTARTDFGVSTLPAIFDHHKKLSAAQTMIEALTKSSQEASISVLAKDFNEKFEELRNLSPLQASVKQYETNSAQLEEVAASLAFDRAKDLQAAIETALKQTEEEIARLQTEYTTDFSLEDAGFQQALKAQRQTAIQQLMHQRDQIEKEWNTFCFSLNEAKQAFSLLSRTKEYTASIGNAYLAAEDIYQTLRHTRKWTTNRHTIEQIQGHEEIFEAQHAAFLRLSQQLNPKKEEAKDDGLDLIEPMAKGDNFYSLCQQTLIPGADIQALQSIATEEEAQKMGLVWSSESKKSEVMAALKTQKEKFALASLKHNQEVKKAYELTLNNILNLARDELNVMGTALSISTHAYDNRFNEVYYRKNKASRYFGAGVSTITYGLSAAATGAMSLLSSKEAGVELQNGRAVSAWEDAPPVKRLFIPVKSPLEAVSKL